MSELTEKQVGLVPYLTVVNAQAAIEFYSQAFKAEQQGIALTDPDGRIMHVEMTLGGGRLMLAEHLPEYNTLEPLSLGGTPVRLSLEVANADDTVAAAVALGAKVQSVVEDQFHGQRSGRIEDPFGHVWVVSHVIEEMTREEMQTRMTRLFSNG